MPTPTDNCNLVISPVGHLHGCRPRWAPCGAVARASQWLKHYKDIHDQQAHTKTGATKQSCFCYTSVPGVTQQPAPHMMIEELTAVQQHKQVCNHATASAALTHYFFLEHMPAWVSCLSPRLLSSTPPLNQVGLLLHVRQHHHLHRVTHRAQDTFRKCRQGALTINN